MGVTGDQNITATYGVRVDQNITATYGCQT